MYIFATLMVASNLSVAAPICTENIDYDKEREICLATQEDVKSLQHLRFAEGLVYGKKTYFILEKIPFKNGNGKQQWLRSGEVHSAFMRMIKEAKKRRFKFGINSSFRTLRHQRRLWREMPDVASNPYKSGPKSHMTGHAVDFSGTYAFVPFDKVKRKWFSKRWCKPVEDGFECPTKFFWWLKKNALKYGFKNTVESEPWHWRFVGNEDERDLVMR